VLRAERTRRSVVEALLDLVGEGELHPTARQVSDRSGVSMRSIFRLFEDVEALHAEGVSVQMARVAPLFAAPEPSGPVDERAAALVAQRTRLYETISPVRRLAIRLAPRSRPIAASLARSNAVLREQLSAQFAPELAALRPSPRAEAIEALDAVTSWETWERLRTGQRLDAARAARISTATALAVLSALD
jgi:TetR/AcrR family transcriptional regulator, regulator of autoinduction and epiphytic fitness